jgi:hypothetical protein
MSYIGTNDQVVDVLLRKVLQQTIIAFSMHVWNSGIINENEELFLRLSIDHLISTMCGSVVVNH